MRNSPYICRKVVAHLRVETSTSVKRLTARIYLGYIRGSVSRPEHREVVRLSEQPNGQLDRKDQDPRRGLLYGGPGL